MFRFYFALLLLVLAGAGLFAQDKPGKAEKRQLKTAAKLEIRSQRIHYLTLELGGAFGQTLDRRMALNRYAGAGLYAGAGITTWGPKGWKYHDLLATRFLGIAQSHAQSIAFNTFNESQGLYFQRLADRGGWQLYAGGGWSTLVNARINPALGNSSVHGEALISGQAGALAARNVKIPLLGNCRVEYLLRLPLFTAVGRVPSYGLSGLGGPSLALAPLGDFTRVSSRLAISRPIRKGNPNHWQLAYSWDFYSYNDNEIHPLRVANHALTYSLFIRTGRLDWSKN